jgi:diacylglycerol kinase family enzyme
MSKIEVIINAAGGSFAGDHTEQHLREAFAASGLDVNLRLAKSGSEIESMAEEAAESNAEILVAGGGDGTISMVASKAAEAGKVLGVIPLGTLNHFSKDLNIPQTIPEAVSVLSDNNLQNVDVGEVNGRIFLNNSSIGLYPRIVRRRQVEQERLGKGKWSAAFSAAWRVFLRRPFIVVKIRLRERIFIRKTPFVFIGNNEYHMDLYNIGRRERLDGGRLSLYFPHRGGRVGVLVLLVKTVFGLLRQAKEFETLSTEKVTLRTPKPRVITALDGETVVMDSPLEYRILPGYLRVLVPRTGSE